MHGPHKSRWLLVGGLGDATVRPFLVPLRCYYCATLIGQKSTLIRPDIYMLFHLGQSWMKQVGEDPRIVTHKLYTISYIFLPSILCKPLYSLRYIYLFLYPSRDSASCASRNLASCNFECLYDLTCILSICKLKPRYLQSRFESVRIFVTYKTRTTQCSRVDCTTESKISPKYRADHAWP